MNFAKLFSVNFSNSQEQDDESSYSTEEETLIQPNILRPSTPQKPERMIANALSPLKAVSPMKMNSRYNKTQEAVNDRENSELRRSNRVLAEQNAGMARNIKQLATSKKQALEAVQKLEADNLYLQDKCRNYQELDDTLNSTNEELTQLHIARAESLERTKELTSELELKDSKIALLEQHLDVARQKNAGLDANCTHYAKQIESQKKMIVGLQAICDKVVTLCDEEVTPDTIPVDKKEHDRVMQDLEREYFSAIALVAKLNLFNCGNNVKNLAITDMYDIILERNVPRIEWHATIIDMLRQ